MSDYREELVKKATEPFSIDVSYMVDPDWMGSLLQESSDVAIQEPAAVIPDVPETPTPDSKDYSFVLDAYAEQSFRPPVSFDLPPEQTEATRLLDVVDDIGGVVDSSIPDVEFETGSDFRFSEADLPSFDEVQRFADDYARQVESQTTPTQRAAQSRGDALRARQARKLGLPDPTKPQANQPKQAQPSQLSPGRPERQGVSNQPNGFRGVPTQETEGSQREHIVGEQQPNRSPNFRAEEAGYNSSVDEFATVVADSMTMLTTTLSIQADRIRRLERIIKEASQ